MSDSYAGDAMSRSTSSPRPGSPRPGTNRSPLLGVLTVVMRSPGARAAPKALTPTDMAVGRDLAAHHGA